MDANKHTHNQHFMYISHIHCQLPPSEIFIFIATHTDNACINMHTYKTPASICKNIQRRNVDFCAFLLILKTSFCYFDIFKHKD